MDERRGNGFYENRFFDQLENSIKESEQRVVARVDQLANKVNRIADEQREVRQALNQQQETVLTRAQEMVPKLHLMQWQPEEQTALRSMVARELAGEIIRTTKARELSWSQTKNGRLVLWIGIAVGILTIISILIGTALTIYNATQGVAHPIGGHH